MPRERGSEIVPIEEIKFVFNTDSLQPGDILLMNTYHEGQRRMMERKCGSCIFDHAALYIGDAQLMEANGLGVVMNHIFSRGFKGEGDACVMRLKNASPITISHAIYCARAFMGMEFDGKGAKAVPIYKGTDQEDTSNRTFCSRMVAQCYSQVGIQLFPNPAFCSPDDFLNCDQLFKVADPLQPFTSEMEQTVINKQNERNTFEYATYWARPFAEFSALYDEDVQTAGQLMEVASRHIDLDDAAIEIIKRNKLYQPVEDRKANTPWIDNDDDFFNHFKSTERCLFFLVCQMLHYDLTYIPAFKDNIASTCYAAYLCPKSKVIVRMKQGSLDVYYEAEYIRKRFAHLYKAVAERDSEGYSEFVGKYGEYKNVEYIPTPLSLDNVLFEIMRAWFHAENND